MPGLIDSDTGLTFGEGLAWLLGGLGGPGLDDEPIGAMAMVVESPNNTLMLTETGLAMLTEADAPAWVLSSGGVAATLDIDFLSDQAWNAPSEVSIDALLTCTRATPTLATYTDASGVVSYFAPDTLRYGDVGLLVEAGRTNLILRSNEPGNGGGWGAAGITNFTVTTAGPDGVAGSATLLNEDTSNGGHFVYQQISKAASAITYTATLYQKQGPGRTRSTWAIYTGATGNGFYATFDLAGAQIGPVVDRGGGGYTSITTEVTALANGWCRCRATFTTDDGVTTTMLVENDNGSGTAARSDSYVGVVGDGIYWFGAQLEASSFASSYIPTAATSVSRANDVVHFSTFDWYTKYLGTFLVDASGIAASDGRVIGAETGSSPMLFSYNNGNIAATGLGGGGYITANLGGGTTWPTGSKAGVSVSGTDASLVAGGGTVTTTSDCPDGFGITTPTLGAGNGSDVADTRTYRRFSFWIVKLPDASMQSLTAP